MKNHDLIIPAAITISFTSAIVLESCCKVTYSSMPICKDVFMLLDCLPLLKARMGVICITRSQVIVHLQ
ncbi:hypothetical protein SORBI_3005G062100 [Sorghum bicolor]|uniref:Uncharacterized protein n=1 Tax=Sorghum bicolor TaxID=4558 RepID=A0A1B6PQI0_SORBI|nr:hypothetical protein SORBI_3005G062100 [Sorghum bicolor]